MIRNGIKESCSLEGLEPDYFSSHSLRKGATTHMMSLGVPEAAVKDIGNYVLSKCVSTDITYLYDCYVRRFYINATAGMPEYGVKT